MTQGINTCVRLAPVCAAATLILTASAALAEDDGPALTLTPTASKSSPGVPVDVVLTARHVPEGATIELHNPHRGQLWYSETRCSNGGKRSQSFALHAAHAIVCLNSETVQDVSAVATTQLPSGPQVIGSSPAVTFTKAQWWEAATFTTVLGALLGVISTLITTHLSQGREERQKAAASERAFLAEQQSFLLRQLFPEMSGHSGTIAANAQLTATNPQQLAALPMTAINDVGLTQRRSVLESYLRGFKQGDFLKRVADYAKAVASYNDEVESLSRSKGSVTRLQTLGDSLVRDLRALGLA